MGRLWLRAGRVVSARIEGSRRVNRAAIYELLTWERGLFAFTQANLATAVDEISAPTTLLLVEAARRVDEAAASASASAVTPRTPLGSPWGRRGTGL